MCAQQVDNSLSPHGGVLVDKVVVSREEARKLVDECTAVLRVSGRMAREVVSIAYGFFSPLAGFMGRKDLESVCRQGRLTSGLVWPLPVVCDVNPETVQGQGIKSGTRLLMEYHNLPLAVMDVEEVYSYDRSMMAEQIYEMDNVDHPGIRQVHALGETFLGGPVRLVNEPVFQEPYAEFFIPPARMRRRFQDLGWERIAAFHTTSVPHLGHEWLMKAAWFQHRADGLLVSCAVGDKRLGDCIDETVLLGHAELQRAGYFQPKVHLVSMVLWDRRFAGPKEAVAHAIIRKNLGCTGHIFGKNHAQAEGFGEPWSSHFAFRSLPYLGIDSILSREWFYCRHCEGVTCSSFCTHGHEQEAFRSESVCSLLSTGIKPASRMLRPEVFDTVIGASDKYGFGDGYVTEEYLKRRGPVFTLNKL